MVRRRLSLFLPLSSRSSTSISFNNHWTLNEEEILGHLGDVDDGDGMIGSNRILFNNSYIIPIKIILYGLWNIPLHDATEPVTDAMTLIQLLPQKSP